MEKLPLLTLPAQQTSWGFHEYAFYKIGTFSRPPFALLLSVVEKRRYIFNNNNSGVYIFMSRLKNESAPHEALYFGGSKLLSKQLARYSIVPSHDGRAVHASLLDHIDSISKSIRSQESMAILDRIRNELPLKYVDPPNNPNDTGDRNRYDMIVSKLDTSEVSMWWADAASSKFQCYMALEWSLGREYSAKSGAENYPDDGHKHAKSYKNCFICVNKRTLIEMDAALNP